ncbi:MAG: formylglycine-generating enzyme family protein [Gemmatimonadota bacterium]|nr:formylglycine-generating enzyme family protein [Gemmatimonadota bacterium]MDE2873426.1 formylglycine-generating enzyme family protein [Gemmatimonadota bacterium]
MKALLSGTAAICGLTLLAGMHPAAAQSGLGAVACVGSELDTEPGTNPEEMIHGTDREVLYRVGVELAERQEVDRTLRSQLAGYPRTFCSWSGIGDSHLVVIRYIGGAARQDPASDNGGDGLQAFAVGYGTNWGFAEVDATTHDERFGEYNDRAGYEVLARETWGARVGDEGPGVRQLVPGQMFQECAVCPEMVVLPAESYRMGSRMGEWDRQNNEMSARRVKISAPFAVGIYEVTFAEWDACVRAGGCAGYRPDDEGWGRGKRPVINVSQRDARRYARWLSEHTGAEYRLLTEGEWEYAARGGTSTARHWGEGEWTQCRYANGWGSVAQCSDGFDHAAPVGSLAPNDFGLYDVLGNVWEWTENCWKRNRYGGMSESERRKLHSPNRLGYVPSGSLRDCSRGVLRGGSWHSYYWQLRSASRKRLWGGIRLDYNGFRIARTIS